MTPEHQVNTYDIALNDNVTTCNMTSVIFCSMFKVGMNVVSKQQINLRVGCQSADRGTLEPLFVVGQSSKVQVTKLEGPEIIISDCR